MNDRNLRPHWSVLLAVVGSVSGARAAAPTMSAEQGWAAVERCAGQASERQRHTCLDDLLRRAGLLTPQAEAGQQRREFGLDTAASRAAAEAPKTATPAPAAPPPGRSEAPPLSPAGASPPERLEVQLASARMGNDGKVLLTMADGAVWRQIDSDTIPRLPADGATVRIRKATLGSYLCELPSRHTFRCQRQK